jgi:hypothetical protein
MFITAITLAMVFLVQWFSEGRRRDILLSAMLFAIASSVRYEGWVFVALFVVLVIFLCLGSVNSRRFSFKTAAGPFLLSASFALLWVTLHFIQHGRPFGFVADTTGRYAVIHGDSPVSLLSDNPFTQFMIQNASTLNILGILSIPAFVRKGISNKLLTLLPVFALLIVSAIAFWGKGMPTHGFWRIPAVWSVLLIPCTAYWFASRLRPDNTAMLKKIGLASLLVAMLLLCLHGIYSMTGHSAFSNNDLATGRYVHEQLLELTPSNSHMVLIESGIWSYLNVMVASQHPEQFVLNSGFDPVAHGDPLLNPDAPFDQGTLKRMDVDLLVFRREDYKDFLEARAEIKRLNSFGPWTVYALVP